MTNGELAIILRALALEYPLLGAVNRRIVELGGQPMTPREPWLTQARQEAEAE